MSNRLRASGPRLALWFKGQQHGAEEPTGVKRMYENITRIENEEQAVELLQKAVETRGRDYVYQKRIGPVSASKGEGERCSYTYGGEPDCLIGVALSLAGWTPEMLSELDVGLRGGVPISTLGRELMEFGPLVSPTARAVLQAAQDAQDAGETWGAALDAARRTALLYS